MVTGRAAEADRSGTPAVSLAKLITACRDETSRFQRGEVNPGLACFEIFRRAICQRDQAAWSFLVEQYRGVLLSAVRRHPAFALAREDEAYWVNRTFERFWGAVKAERFDQFRGLPALIAYLKMCVHSVLCDALRAQRAEPAASGAELLEDARHATTIEEPVLGRLARRELWMAVLRELPDESEQRVAYLSFVLEMKPGDVFAREPQRFESVNDVYRIKRNVLDRLRNSPRIQAFLV
jgi:DNA-directed RNA polymerase specialized sigma24 family protein